MDYIPIYFALVLTVVLMGHIIRPSAIRVKALRLVDRYGRVRASLETSADGKPGLWLYDTLGRPAAVFGLLAESVPRFSPFGPDHMEEALMVGREAAPGLMLLDGAGRIRAVLDTRRDGTPGLSLRDAKGEELFSAP